MLSLRDPEGFLFASNGALYRFVTRAAADRLDAFLHTSAYRDLREAGLVVATRRAESGCAPRPILPERFRDTAGEIFAHEKVPFPSYPFEWHPAMLADAARATLDIALAVAADGYTLKDATPFNVLFDGQRPVFVDLLSIDRQPDGYPYWLAEAQYIRTFALPLIAYRRAGLTLGQIFLCSREGMESSELLTRSRAADWLSPAHWLYVRLPAWLQRRSSGARLDGAYRRSTRMRSDSAAFVYRSTLQRHRTLLDWMARGRRARSAWSGYTRERSHYEEDAVRRKRDLVGRFHEESRPRTVLDIGANTGEFSELAARNGGSVVALDSDLDSVGGIYARSIEHKLRILPLHINFAAPSPGTGWRNSETISFVDRARDHFDAVLMLAVIHHLVITEGIPLPTLIEEVARVTKQFLVIEHVGPQDPMSQLLLKGRDHLAAALEQSAFEATLTTHFSIIRREPLGARTLYVCRRAR